MKKQFKKWTFRLSFTLLFLIALLVTFMLNPMLLYANKTEIGNYSIYHNQPLNPELAVKLEQSINIIKASELYDPSLKMDICIKDGSKYPGLIEKVLGRDVLTSFYNKIVFTGDEYQLDKNYIQFYEHKWNLTEMLAHVQIHCLQFNKYGLWKSNPIGKHPEWKWEGYPEYVARKNAHPEDLQSGIRAFLMTKADYDRGWMPLPDSTETLVHYFKYRLLIQYGMEVRKMSFDDLLRDTTSEETMKLQMMNWYNKQAD